MLKLTKTSNSGVTVTDAIHKITSITVASNGETYLEVAMLVDEAAIVPLETHGYTFTVAVGAGCAFSQCYDYLKTLPEYAGAIDV